MNVALILGTTSDIAQATAELLAQRGYKLILAGRKEKALHAMQSDLNIRFGVETTYRLFDALQFHEHEEFYQSLPYKPNLVICAIGVLGDQQKAETDWHASKEIIDANYTGCISILNIVGNDMEKRKSGCIVGISSVAGERGRMSNYIYGSAKAGFTAYLSGLRNRLYKSGVSVLTVKPGFVATKMTEHLELPTVLTAKPHRVARAIVKGVEKGRSEIYVFGIWRWIMLIIKLMPEFIFKRMSL